jgi:hypothetical protein
MPTARYWNCKQTKPGVFVCPTNRRSTFPRLFWRKRDRFLHSRKHVTSVTTLGANSSVKYYWSSTAIYKIALSQTPACQSTAFRTSFSISLFKAIINRNLIRSTVFNASHHGFVASQEPSRARWLKTSVLSARVRTLGIAHDGCVMSTNEEAQRTSG